MELMLRESVDWLKEHGHERSLSWVRLMVSNKQLKARNRCGINFVDTDELMKVILEKRRLRINKENQNENSSQKGTY